MKKLIKTPFNLFIVGLLFASSLTFVQCKKDDTEGQITFQYLDGRPAAGATVTLFIDTNRENVGFHLCNSKNELTTKKTYVTNSSGVVNECFDLPALINVYATITTDYFVSPLLGLNGSLFSIPSLDSALFPTTSLDSLLESPSLNRYTGEGKLNLIANEKTSITIKMK